MWLCTLLIWGSIDNVWLCFCRFSRKRVFLFSCHYGWTISHVSPRTFFRIHFCFYAFLLSFYSVLYIFIALLCLRISVAAESCLTALHRSIFRSIYEKQAEEHDINAVFFSCYQQTFSSLKLGMVLQHCVKAEKMGLALCGRRNGSAFWAMIKSEIFLPVG